MGMKQETSSDRVRLEGGRYQRDPRKTTASGHPLVTIVTIALNKKAGLGRTAESVKKQMYDNIEHIVIDGGSTDGSVDLLRSLDDSIDHWISEPDSGIAAAFNKGIGLANGDLVAFLNAGDWYEPDAVAAICQAYVQHPGSDVICGAIRLRNPDSSALVCLSDPSRVEEESSVYHPAVFVKRSAFTNIGMFDEHYLYAMDYELMLRFKRRGAKFLSITAVIANMNLDGVSYKHWYSGLSEVRQARAVYFPSYDVLIRHWIAVIKNLAARTLKMTGLSGVYRFYWYNRNESIRKHS